MRWHATSFSRFGRREYFYATPTVAYGRVFVGNTDGTVYAFGAATGNLLWARARRHVRLHRARRSGERRCTSAPGTASSSRSTRAPETSAGATTLRRRSPARRRFSPGSSTSRPAAAAGVGGLRRVKVGPNGTFALNARNGSLVWRFHAGKYSPVVADGLRLYVVGRDACTRSSRGLACGRSGRRRRRRSASDSAAGKRPRSRSAAKPGTSSGRPG